jgi:hypothetical protein
MRTSRLSPARVKFPKYSYEIEFESLKNRITKFIEKSQ